MLKSRVAYDHIWGCELIRDKSTLIHFISEYDSKPNMIYTKGLILRKNQAINTQFIYRVMSIPLKCRHTVQES